MEKYLIKCCANFGRKKTWGNIFRINKSEIHKGEINTWNYKLFPYQLK